MILDIENHATLRAYLIKAGRLGSDEPATFRNLSGGVSNRAVWMDLPGRGQAWVFKQALEKLRVQADWYCDPARIEREALGLRHLSTLAPDAITPLIFEDKTLHLLAMQAVPLPHHNWKQNLMGGIIERKAVGDFGRLLAQIHRASWQQRAELATLFDDRRFFEALRLEPYYEYSAQHAPQAAPFLKSLVEETRATRCALAHGDYSPKNILVRKGELFLLDHEVIHWGDPAFDVGFAFAHFFGKAHHFRERRAEFLEAAAFFWQEYETGVREISWARELEARVVRHGLACTLARAVGRSPLEYLSDDERGLQKNIASSLMLRAPQTIAELIAQFGARLAHIPRP